MYNFLEIMPILEKLRQGYDFVIGNRYKAKIAVFTDNIGVSLRDAQVVYSYQDKIDINFVIDAAVASQVSNISLTKDNQCVQTTNNLTNTSLQANNSYNVTLTHNGLSTISNDEYTIEVTLSSGIKITLPVTINMIPINNINITNEEGLSIDIGSHLQMTYELLPANNNITDPTVTWASLDESVATINQTGLVTAIKPGNVTITASTTNNIVAEYQLTIESNVKSLRITSNITNIIQGNEVTLDYECTTSNNVDCVQYLKWSSSDESIAQVVDGLVIPKKLGKATITAKLLRTKITDTVTIDIIEKTKAKYVEAYEKITGRNF